MKTILTLIGLSILTHTQADVLFEIDFSKAEGNVKAWCKENGWQPEAAFYRMKPRFEDGALVIKNQNDYSGALIFTVPDSLDLSTAKSITIDWQVDQYPAAAEWEGPADQKRNTRQALAVIISFGPAEFSSGVPFKKVPYFMALFPSNVATTHKIYTGNYFRASGRYICIDGSGTTDPLLTHYELPEHFQTLFNTNAPLITAIGIEVDAKNTPPVNGIHSAARIRRITISNEMPAEPNLP